MKRISSVLVLLCCCPNLTAGLKDLQDVFPSTAEARPYIQANYAGLSSGLESGGFNTFGAFSNTGGDSSQGSGAGGALGFVTELSTLRVRTEVEGLWRQDSDFVTNSFPDPVAFSYHVKSSDNWSAMSNIWLDSPVADNLWLYCGGGIGAAGTRLSISDTVVTGEKAATNFAYQIGTGLIAPVGDNAEFDLGYRFFDLGSETVGLDGGTSGNYTADMVSHQFMVSLRIYLR